MTWQGVEGHDEIAEMFRSSVQRDRLGSTFLFVGPLGVGKRLFALQLAKALLCDRCEPGALDACGSCSGCQQVAARTHPDLLIVSKPVDKSVIPLDLLIGRKERRMREGLCYDISLKPFLGGRRVAIIDDADHFNQEGANCLLKTLEEPPPRSVIILIGTSLQQQLPTIRSRCQIIRFATLPSSLVTRIMLQEGMAETEATAASLAAVSGGSLETAARMNDPDLVEFQAEIPRLLARPWYESLAVAKRVIEFVEQAGTDNPARRERLRSALDDSLDYFARLLRHFAGRDRDAATAGLARDAWSSDPDLFARCIDRCLDAQAQLAANAHLPTLVDCWIDDLATIQKTAA